MRTVQKAMIYLVCVGILAFGLAYGQSDAEIVFTGRVLDDQGNPVAEAQVCLYEMTSTGVANTYDIQTHRVVTSTDGQFRLTTSPRGSVYRYGRIFVQKKGMATHWIGWDFRSNQQGDIILGESNLLEGLVTDMAGRPLDQAKVTFALARKGDVTGNNGFGHEVASRAMMVETDKSGQFEFSNLPEDAQFELLVSKPGYATVSTLDWSSFNYQDKLKYHAGQPDIHVQLPPEATISGITVDGASGRFVPGMEMVLFGNTHRKAWGQKPFKTDQAGRFVLSGLAAGKYRLELASGDRRAEPMPWVAPSLPIELASGEALKQAKFELEKGGMLEVHVTDSADSMPVEKARVSLSSPATNLSFYGLTDDTGLARIRLLPGAYELRCPTKEGYAYHYDDKKNVVMGDGQVQRMSWTLTAQPKISGVVRDPDGLPLGGVEIQICPGSRNTVQSNSDGTYDMVWNDGGWPREDTVFYMIAQDKGRDLGLALPVSKDIKSLDLALKPAVTLAGRVMDDNGKGIADARIRTMLRASNWGASFGDYRNLPTTDANGSYEIKSLPPENRYSLTATAQGYGEAQVDIDTHDAVDNRLDVELMTLATANLQISGQVVDDEGRPVAKARVNARGEGQPNVRAATDAQGQFLLDGLCEGAVYVSVDRIGEKRLSARATVEAGASHITLTLGEGRPANRYIRSKTYDEILATGQFVAGYAVDESGLPVAGVPVNVQAIRRERAEGKFSWTYSSYNRLGDVTDDQGRFIIAVEEDAAYCLLFSPRRQAAIIQYDVPMKTKDLQVTLPQGGTVNGRLLGIKDGRKVPIPHAEVTIEQTNRASYSHLGFDQDRTTKTDENGCFSFKHLRTVYRSGRNEGTYDTRPWELSYGDLKQTVGFYDNEKTLDVKLLIKPKLEDAAPLNGKALPAWNTLGVTVKPALIQDKPLLVCFFDYEQRLDRRRLSQIARNQSLVDKGISVIAIDLSGTDKDTLKSWADNLSLFMVTQITGDKDEVRFNWNVQSLPWLILTNEDHKVVGEGLSVEEVLEQL